MEIERAPRVPGGAPPTRKRIDCRRSHLAQIGEYSSDDDGLIALLGARASEC